jgi:ABC-type uncharacterized transport system ATPase subunit
VSAAPTSTTPDGLALVTRGHRKKYGSRTALAGLDLSVPSGVVYGFLGPNGAARLWLVGALVISAVFTERAEISG